MGKQIAEKANRDGGAERCSDPAVHKSSDVARALLGHDDQRLRDVELSLLTTAKPPDAHPR
jgi:hypothetical protein